MATRFAYFGMRSVPQPMPKMEGWVPEEPYPAMVVPEQFWELHLKEAWGIAGDRRSPFTWGPASESVAGICGVRKVVRYIEPPCWYTGSPDFYVQEAFATQVRFASIAVMMERITQAFFKLDEDRIREAFAVMRDCRDRLNEISNAFTKPGITIRWFAWVVPYAVPLVPRLGGFGTGEVGLRVQYPIPDWGELTKLELGKVGSGGTRGRTYIIGVRAFD